MDPMGYNWRFLEALTIRVKHQESPTPEQLDFGIALNRLAPVFRACVPMSVVLDLIFQMDSVR